MNHLLKDIEASIRKLVYFADHFDVVPVRFEFPRDPKDAKFIALAIAGKATNLVTFDNDLLSLMKSRSDAARRMRHRTPHLRIEPPGDFLNELEAPK